MSQQTTQPSNGGVVQLAIAAATSDLAVPSVPASTTRRVVEFVNNGAVAVYVSASSAYATAKAKGRPIAAGGSWTDSASSIAWYVFADSGTADVRVTIVEAP